MYLHLYLGPVFSSRYVCFFLLSNTVQVTCKQNKRWSFFTYSRCHISDTYCHFKLNNEEVKYVVFYWCLFQWPELCCILKYQQPVPVKWWVHCVSCFCWGQCIAKSCPQNPPKVQTTVLSPAGHPAPCAGKGWAVAWGTGLSRNHKEPSVTLIKWLMTFALIGLVVSALC